MKEYKNPKKIIQVIMILLCITIISSNIVYAENETSQEKTTTDTQKTTKLWHL